MMINTEEIISTAKCTLPADVREGEPQSVGRRAARFGTEVLFDELMQRGYTKAAIIEGLKEAVSDAEAGVLDRSA